MVGIRPNGGGATHLDPTPPCWLKSEVVRFSFQKVAFRRQRKLNTHAELWVCNRETLFPQN